MQRNMCRHCWPTWYDWLRMSSQLLYLPTAAHAVSLWLAVHHNNMPTHACMCTCMCEMGHSNMVDQLHWLSNNGASSVLNRRARTNQRMAVFWQSPLVYNRQHTHITKPLGTNAAKLKDIQTCASIHYHGAVAASRCSWPPASTLQDLCRWLRWQ